MWRETRVSRNRKSVMADIVENYQHAALWLIGPDMPGLLRMGATYVLDRGGNIDKDIADKFGEKAVVFLSITAEPDGIRRMDRDKDQLRRDSGCGVVFQPMNSPTVPDEFQQELHGFDIVTDDRPGMIADLTELLEKFSILIVGHAGERYIAPLPEPHARGGQKCVVLLPKEFDLPGFTRELDALVWKYNGMIKTPLRKVPGLLWWW